MESFGLVTLIAVLALAVLLICMRLATIALRLARFSRLKRTSMVLPAVRPQSLPQSEGQPRSPFVPRSDSSWRDSTRLPIEVVVAHPTLPPERSSTQAHPSAQRTNRKANRS